MKYDFNCPLQFQKALEELEEKGFNQKPSEMWVDIEHE